MVKIKVLKDTFIDGKPVLAGKEQEVNERTAELLIGRNKAEKVEEKKEEKQPRGKRSEGITDDND